MKTTGLFRAGFIVMLLASGAFAQHNGHDMTGSDKGNTMTDNAKGKGMNMGMMDRDKMFIEHMITHHQDAIDMAKLALEKSKKDEIKKLAGDIIKAQSGEIEMMKKWYRTWYNMEVPAMGMGQGGMMNRGAMGDNSQMMGMCMMGQGKGGMMRMDLNYLKSAIDFDRAFIEMMVKHHAMAVMMSGMIIDSRRGEMRKLGRDINSAQSAEIEQMIQWYIKWYGAWK